MKKNYNSFDIAKFICAIMIICAHYGAERASFPKLVDDMLSIYIVAVPFFYACSGFFLFKKLSDEPKVNQHKIFIKYAKRILSMYLAWSLVYFIFILRGWLLRGVTIETVLRYLYQSIVFTTYPTIWFLPALVIAVAMVYYLSKRFSFRTIFFVSLIFYAIGSFGYSYSFVSEDNVLLSNLYEKYSNIFITTRNGIFNGFTFVALGAFIANSKNKLSMKFSGAMTLLFLLILTLEAYFLRIMFGNLGADTVFFLIPFTYFVLYFFLSWEIPDRSVYITLRKISLLMFTSQRLFLTALPSVLPTFVMSVLTHNSYVGLFTIVSITFIFSLIIIRLTNRVSFLKILW